MGSLRVGKKGDRGQGTKGNRRKEDGEDNKKLTISLLAGMIHCEAFLNLVSTSCLLGIFKVFFLKLHVPDERYKVFMVMYYLIMV
jgi:hypothetical protein